MAEIAGEFAGGFAAATISPLFCTIGIVLWDKYWFGIGKGHAYMLNIFKGCAMGILFAIWTGIAFANGANGCWSTPAIAWLCFSSFIGIVIGDTFWLFALNRLGSKEMILIDSLKPFQFALFAFGILEEEILWPWWVGCTITMGAIAWVATERERQPSPTAPTRLHEEADEREAASIEIGAVALKKGGTTSTQQLSAADDDDAMLRVSAGLDATDGLPGRRPRRAHPHLPPGHAESPPPWACLPQRKLVGLLAAAINVTFDQLGAVITKKYASELQTWEINLVRFGFAALCMLIPVPLRAVLLQASGGGGWTQERIWAVDRAAGNWHSLPALGSIRSWCMIYVGCLFTTFACPILSTWSLFRVPAALYGVLTSTGPIYSLFVVRVIKSERSSARAWCGAALAVVGVAFLACQSQLYALTEGVTVETIDARMKGAALVRYCWHASPPPPRFG